MSKCLGPLHWPCDHEEKHRRAALLGWAHRGHIFNRRADRAALADLGIHRAHTDKSHKGMVRFQEKGSSIWHELPKSSFEELVHATKAELRQRRNEQKLQDINERILNADRRAQHAAVIKAIRGNGGIKPERIPSGSGRKRPPNYEEWQGLPKQVRVNNKRDSRVGMTLDDMATFIEGEFHLGIQDGDDLARYLDNERLHRRDRRYKLRKHHRAA